MKQQDKIATDNTSQENEQFAYTLAHDLQEPLNTLSGFLNLLEKNKAVTSDADASKYIRFSQESAERLHKLITDSLLYFSTGKQVDDFEEVDLNEVLKITRGMFLVLKDDHSHILESDQLPVVFGSRTQMIQLFQNLVGNAVKYVQKGNTPCIRITCSESENEWIFSVRDKGIGIRPEHHEKIFGTFNRLHKQSEYAGSGIGLAICRKIVALHAGTMHVESAMGQGSNFIFTINKQLKNQHHVQKNA
ncbi:MAG TPA: ATP-binding protein [Flavobacteriales bacterium]|nr:ATP-binding protein [Flavobacteriales bacterium]